MNNGEIIIGATICHICLKRFDPKVKDHCHCTGKYRGPTHRNCNLRYMIPNYIPIIFHNLSRYDAHVFIRELGKKFSTGKIGVIVENKEKYIRFNVDVVVDSYTDDSSEVKEKKIQLRFIDSFRFMASSLDSLTNNLVGVSGMVCDIGGEVMNLLTYMKIILLTESVRIVTQDIASGN